MENEHLDQYRTIRTNRSGTEIAQQGVESAAIRIVYTDLCTYRMLPTYHMLGYNHEQDTFEDNGDYRDYYRSDLYPRPLRPTQQEQQQFLLDNPDTHRTIQQLIEQLRMASRCSQT